ncbi:MAG: proline--tRNA ligase [candidate division Zixibacteria bacterium]|nr:proline--tRNA ligase [candidate division Zixibacteria bacterium]
MRWSKTYIPTLREIPVEAELISHQFLLRAGYMRRLAAGVYTYLPLMQRVIDNISRIVREEMNASGSIEILMPVLHPAEIWQKSGRWETMGKEQMRLKDRHLHDLVLGGTHEDVVTDLLSGELKSYKQLPLNLYQIQTKFRDEIRPRFGLMRGREFLMKDAYSFDIDEEGHKIAYGKMVDAYHKIFARCGLPAKQVESDTGAMGGRAAHEFMVPVDTDGGENIILSCDRCSYAANIEKAVFREINPPAKDSTIKAMQEVATPNAATIEQITAFLNLPANRFAKTLLFLADDQPVAAMIRGDRQINEVKLRNHLRCLQLEMAGPEIVEKVTNAPVGFAGPVGLSIPITVDPEVAAMVNCVVGANKADAHILNVNIDRDFKAAAVVDIKNAPAGEGCPRCDGLLVQSRGIEVGNIFMLGTKYSEALGGKFLDAEGKERHYIMGSYGIGITRTAQAAIEKYHDEKGIIWPKAIAPYQVIITTLNMNRPEQQQAAEGIYSRLTAAGYDVLYDDRPERAGVKLNDADLVGIPLRVGIGDKSLADGKVELKLRNETTVEGTPLDRVVEKVKEMLGRAI